jgi:hypothetical protein
LIKNPLTKNLFRCIIKKNDKGENEMYKMNWELRKKLRRYFSPIWGATYAILDELEATPAYTSSVQYLVYFGKWSIKKQHSKRYYVTYEDCEYSITAHGETPKKAYNATNRLVRKIEQIRRK